ncbi:hypothetical protein AYI70_g4766 [Smittium culicis]|uniref:Uncharacterized protein n=1 Tax=Smittium culicis TaxID=133412 RepID=A0A1R1XXQ3_9FUNG|nr:hypothetical protein AYI70_g4766 [Smittium culicis]
MLPIPYNLGKTTGQSESDKLYIETYEKMKRGGCKDLEYRIFNYNSGICFCKGFLNKENPQKKGIDTNCFEVFDPSKYGVDLNLFSECKAIVYNGNNSAKIIKNLAGSDKQLLDQLTIEAKFYESLDTFLQQINSIG